MRKESYENPHEHYQRYMEREAEQYAEGLERAGLQPNKTLTKALFERAHQGAKKDYSRSAVRTRDHNIGVILDNHRQQMNDIKRREARLRLWMCPPIVLLFGFLAWQRLSTWPSSHDLVETLVVSGVYAGIAVAFLAMLVLGAIFDRPKD